MRVSGVSFSVPSTGMSEFSPKVQYQSITSLVVGSRWAWEVAGTIKKQKLLECIFRQ
jgi:hypothetical protein